jgi:hypothetical protein
MTNTDTTPVYGDYLDVRDTVAYTSPFDGKQVLGIVQSVDLTDADRVIVGWYDRPQHTTSEYRRTSGEHSVTLIEKGWV